MRRRALALIFLLASGALAEAPNTSIRPQARPEPAPVQAEVAPASQTVIPKPMPRPEGLAGAVSAPPPETLAAAPAPTGLGLPPAISPKPRPAGLLASATRAPEAPSAPAKPSGKKGRKGSVCGDNSIRGEAISAIPAKYKGCGLDEPVRVTMVSDVALNPAATISCETADALKQWIETGLQPAFGNRQVVELKVAASYICRTRNNKKGAKISEHGRGKAIDIGGFVMSDGTTWTVAGNYNSTVRKAHKAACGIFGTTLGPGSDGYHEDHLHFDIARYNSGPYCR